MRVALDPALVKTGISWYYGDRVHHIKVVAEGNVGGRISDTYRAAEYMTNEIMRIISTFNSGELDILIETPPPNSQYSAGLYLLHGLLYHKLMQHGEDSFTKVRLTGCSPMAIRSALADKKATKGDAVEKAKQLLKSLDPAYSLKTRLASDEADAIILLAISMRDEGTFNHLFEGDVKRITIFKIGE